MEDNALLLLSTDNNKLLQRKGHFGVIEVLNRMNYRIDVNGIIGIYHTSMLTYDISSLDVCRVGCES